METGPLTRSAYFSDLNRRTDAVMRAMAAGHRMDNCPDCGGPRVFSKIRPEARCFRCAKPFELTHVVTKKSSFRKCELCRKPNMAGRSMNSTLCAKCAGMSANERAKRRRWAEEKAAAKHE